MTKVSRNDIYVRDENGPEWFNAFLHSIANSKSDTVHDIVSAIKDETVESRVRDYREQVGLDVLSATDEEDKENIKTASSRPLSIRHAEEMKGVVNMIEDDPKLRRAIDSFCEHSGGTKNTLSIMRFVREKLGKDVVSYTDDELKAYIDQRKKHFKQELTDSGEPDVGRVGLDNEDSYNDDVADYATYDGAKQ